MSIIVGGSLTSSRLELPLIKFYYSGEGLFSFSAQATVSFSARVKCSVTPFSSRYMREETLDVQYLQYQNDLKYHFPRWGFWCRHHFDGSDFIWIHFFPLLQVNQQFGRTIKGEDGNARDLSVNRDFLSSGPQLIFGQLWMLELYGHEREMWIRLKVLIISTSF